MNKKRATEVNIKCGGCATQIKFALEKGSLDELDVDVNQQEVSFSGDVDKARMILEKMGYPEEGSPAAVRFLKKAQSFIS